MQSLKKMRHYTEHWLRYALQAYFDAIRVRVSARVLTVEDQLLEPYQNLWQVGTVV